MDDKTIDRFAKLVELVSRAFSFENMVILGLLSFSIIFFKSDISSFIGTDIPSDVIISAGIALIFSVITISVKIIFTGARKLTIWNKNRTLSEKQNKSVEELLNRLTSKEVGYLSRFYFPEKKEVVCFDESDINVINLIERGILVHTHLTNHWSGTPLKISIEYKDNIDNKFNI